MKYLRSFALVLAALLIVSGVAFGQRTVTQGARITLTVECNVKGAQVWINGTMAGSVNAAITYARGDYTVVVKAPGFLDGSASVSLTAPTTIRVDLQPNQYNLSVTANVKGAEVFINGRKVGGAGATFRYAPGTYQVVVRARGFSDYNTSVNLDSDQTVVADLQPSQYNLSVTANVKGAEVFINGGKVGGAGAVFRYPAGTYQVSVRAPGFNDFNQSIDLAGDRTVAATLTVMQFGLSVTANVKGALVYINGTRVGAAGSTFQYAPGTYQVSVRAPGYVDFNTSVDLSAPSTVVADLQLAQFNLSVSSNVADADVFINGSKVGTVGGVFRYVPGRYQVTVRAPGYVDYNAAVTLAGDKAVRADLALLQYNLAVSANVKGAQVFVNGNKVGAAGSSFALVPGTYQVTVTAPGFFDYNTSVTLSSNQSVVATLNLLQYNLSVGANVKGADVYVNGTKVGQAGGIFRYTPGTYQIVVKAPGYVDFRSAVQLDRDQNVAAELSPISGKLSISVPANSGIMVFVDGHVLARNPNGDIDLPAGVHEVRMELGFMVTTAQVTVPPNGKISVSPKFSVEVR